MKRWTLLITLLLPLEAKAAEVRVDRYDKGFNAAADKVGAPFRINPPDCHERTCNYVGNHGISVATAAPAAGRNLNDSVIRVPLSVSNIEFASILLATLGMFSPDHSDAARATFAQTLSAQLVRDKARAEGRLGGWIYVLRLDPGERWRVIVRKPDA
ncbi:hypothetical protein [Ancylobacter sp. G4_0304]|uniref:hypothetical protein n=1 Tax=Ancylobacter sp. G4_0304 TaxID=3114289 RepID=UPI0039C68676